MKRSTDNRRSPAEVRTDLQKHYGGMAENAPDPRAAERFHRKPYKNSVGKIDRSEKG